MTGQQYIQLSPFTPWFLCLNCFPWWHLNVQYFMLSLETQTCVQNSTRFPVIQYHLKGCGGFTAGECFTPCIYCEFVLAAGGETDNRNRRNSLILMSRSSTEIHRHTLILPCMNGMKTVSPGWWYKRRPVFSQAQGETGKRPTVRLHNWEALSVSAKISDSGLHAHVGC